MLPSVTVLGAGLSAGVQAPQQTTRAGALQRDWQRALQLCRILGAGVAATMLVAGCTKTITAGTVTLPTPLIEPLPVTVGVYYSPELRANEPTARSETKPRLTYKLSAGPAAAAMLDQVFAAMFERTVVVASRPPLPGDGPDVAAVIEPAIFALYVGTKQNLYIHIVINLALFAPDGAFLAGWSIRGTGPGKDAAAALRDAAAVIMTEFAAQPKVKEWLSSIGEPGGDGP